jgi:hypothetical protein
MSQSTEWLKQLVHSHKAISEGKVIQSRARVYYAGRLNDMKTLLLAQPSCLEDIHNSF